MNLSCGSQMIKYLMFGFSFVSVICGIVILAVGAAVKTIYTDYASFLDTKYFSLPNMLIATGAIIFMVSFFGCCGAIRESWIMIGTFSIFLCIIFVFEFASGIAGYVLRDRTADFLQNKLTENLDRYDSTHDVWDLIQENFECCGAAGPADWEGKFDGEYDLPLSCCPTVSGATGAFYCNSYSSGTVTTVTTLTSSTTDTTSANTPNASTSTPYSDGCVDVFGNFVRQHAIQIGGCAMALALLQLFGIAFSCHLMRQLKNSS